ncbi:MAG: K(+)-transporting ATPase subunit C, partial [Candidatus Bipolaricaulota bacterium]
MVEEDEEGRQEERPEEKEETETKEEKAKDEEETAEEEPGKGHEEESEEVKEEEEEVSYPDTDQLSTSRLLTTGFRVVLIALVLTSVLYPLATTGIGNLVWQDNARGDLVRFDGEVVGSKLIGQTFTSEKHFHPRPSSKNYDGMDSGSANLSPENEELTRRAEELLEGLEEEGVDPEEVPVSFVTESGSALDPHITPESAYLQVPRIAEATGIDSDRLRGLIEDLTSGKFLGLYGQKRVNVLELN